ncbi:MAG: FAD:protein FMN transferase [Clostridiales bacterium]|nr:FAD:protein FMN transferase [Clostridiales bacterium]
MSAEPVNKKRKAILAAVLLPVLAAVLVASFFIMRSCRDAGYREDIFLSMDTVISVKIDPDFRDYESVFAKCRELTEKYRMIFDADDPQSEVGRLNALPEEESWSTYLGCSPEFAEIYELGRNVGWLTKRAFSLHLRREIELWKEAEANGRLPDAGAIAAALDSPHAPVLVTDWPSSGPRFCMCGSKLDFGGIAKGAAEQAVVDFLIDSGVGYGVVSFGGNVAVFCKKPGGKTFSVGIKDPTGKQSTVGTLHLTSGFVSVSGNYERYYEIDGNRYGHILDPRTGMPADTDLLSVAVISEKGAEADALSTSLFVMGLERALEFYSDGCFDFEAVFVTADGVCCTAGAESFFEPSE